MEVSTRRIAGGIAGQPLRMIEIKDDLLTALHGTELTWELREGLWSREGIFENEPVQIVRVLNPFGPTPAKLS